MDMTSTVDPKGRSAAASQSSSVPPRSRHFGRPTLRWPSPVTAVSSLGEPELIFSVGVVSVVDHMA
jgi:hypothetical protein